MSWTNASGVFSVIVAEGGVPMHHVDAQAAAFGATSPAVARKVGTPRVATCLLITSCIHAEEPAGGAAGRC